MSTWIAYLHYSNGRTHEFSVRARSYEEAQKRVETIFPNIPYTIELVK